MFERNIEERKQRSQQQTALNNWVSRVNGAWKLLAPSLSNEALGNVYQKSLIVMEHYPEMPLSEASLLVCQGEYQDKFSKFEGDYRRWTGEVVPLVEIIANKPTSK